MGLFTKKEQDIVINGININEVDTRQIVRPFDFVHKHGRMNYGEIFAYAITTRIFDGLRNITWKVNDRNNIMANNIVDFIDTNFNLLIYNYWKLGYAVVMVDKSDIRLPYANEIRLDKYGMIANKNAIAIYSEPYQFDRSSHFKLIQPLLKNIDTNYNNSNFAAENCGMYGVISGGSVPLSPTAKDELQEKLRKDYGFGKDKFNFILSNTDIKYTPINIPVKDLEFSVKVKESVAYLCNFFKVNPMLVFGDSTFNNQAEAVRSFYQNCIQPLAEILLLLARNIYIKVNTSFTQPSTIITYSFENIPEYNTTLSAACAEKSALLDYLLKLKSAGQDVEDKIKKLTADVDSLFNV